MAILTGWRSVLVAQVCPKTENIERLQDQAELRLGVSGFQAQYPFALHAEQFGKPVLGETLFLPFQTDSHAQLFSIAEDGVLHRGHYKRCTLKGIYPLKCICDSLSPVTDIPGKKAGTKAQAERD